MKPWTGRYHWTDWPMGLLALVLAAVIYLVLMPILFVASIAERAKKKSKPL